MLRFFQFSGGRVVRIAKTLFTPLEQLPSPALHAAKRLNRGMLRKTAGFMLCSRPHCQGICTCCFECTVASRVLGILVLLVWLCHPPPHLKGHEWLATRPSVTPRLTVWSFRCEGRQLFGHNMAALPWRMISAKEMHCVGKIGPSHRQQ